MGDLFIHTDLMERLDVVSEAVIVWETLNTKHILDRIKREGLCAGIILLYALLRIYDQ